MHRLRRTATRSALVCLLILGGAACNGDGGGEAEVDTEVSDPLNPTE